MALFSWFNQSKASSHKTNSSVLTTNLPSTPINWPVMKMATTKDATVKKHSGKSMPTVN